MTAILDDIDARPGSAVSLTRTVIGCYLRDIGGWIAVADLVHLLGELGISGPAARNAVTRLKTAGLLVPERGRGGEGSSERAGYRLAAEALPMLEPGDRRIFEVRQMRADDRWCLISFSFAETRRDLRHQLRRRLQWIGCGTVAPGLWICPGHLDREVEGILEALEAREYATVFLADPPRVSGTLAEAVARWWDLGALGEAHLRFLTQTDGLRDAPESLAAAFADYVRLIDSWRPLPYIDPGLHRSLLPSDWPGARSAERFARLVTALQDPARHHVHQVIALPYI